MWLYLAQNAFAPHLFPVMHSRIIKVHRKKWIKDEKMLMTIIFPCKILISNLIDHVSAEVNDMVEVESLKGRKDSGICE